MTEFLKKTAFAVSSVLMIGVAVSCGGSSGGGMASDTMAPVILLTGTDPLVLETGRAYIEPGATATDNLDGNLTSSIIIDNTHVNVMKGGSYSVTYRVADSAGNEARESRAVDVVDVLPALPQGWRNQDTGDVRLSGNAVYSDGAFTISGAGEDIWNQADAFHFVYKSLSGDGEITARIADLDPVDPYTKAGVMIREDLTADSAHVMANITPIEGTYATWRSLTGDFSDSKPGDRSARAPYWTRLTRSGDIFKTYGSSDGSNWNLMDIRTIGMSSAVYIGLAVTSHNATTLAQAQFTDVVIEEQVNEPEAGDRPWEALMNEVVGFGRATTGGQGGEVCWVTNLNDSGSGSLRACAESDGKSWIRSRASGTISLNSPILVTSDKTIDGRGAHITVENYGFKLYSISNVIIHNIEIQNVNGPANNESEHDKDALSIRDSRNIWIDHVSSTNIADEHYEIGHASTDITLSWNKFWNSGAAGRRFAVIIGFAPNQTEDVAIKVSMHHNFFDRMDERQPRLRFGKVHAFNNYFYDWYSGYAAGSSMRGELYSEANIYEPIRDDDAILTQTGLSGGLGSDPERGYAKSINDWFIGDVFVDVYGKENVFDPAAFYPYSAEQADSALRSKVKQNAGWRDVPAP